MNADGQDNKDLNLEARRQESAAWARKVFILKLFSHRGHSAAEPQPKEITPSLPSPLEGEGEGGGDSLQNLKSLHVSSTENTEIRKQKIEKNLTLHPQNRSAFAFLFWFLTVNPSVTSVTSVANKFLIPKLSDFFKPQRTRRIIS
jgi:hypothetical protein